MIISIKKRSDFLKMKLAKTNLIKKKISDSLNDNENIGEGTNDRYFFPCKYFLLQVRLRHDGESPHRINRLGLTASKKIGNAVIRNRAKRRLKSLYRLDNLANNENNCDIVLIATAQSATCDFHQMQELFAKNIAKIPLFNKNSDII